MSRGQSGVLRAGTAAGLGPGVAVRPDAAGRTPPSDRATWPIRVSRCRYTEAPASRRRRGSCVRTAPARCRRSRRPDRDSHAPGPACPESTTSAAVRDFFAAFQDQHRIAFLHRGLGLPVQVVTRRDVADPGRRFGGFAQPHRVAVARQRVDHRPLHHHRLDRRIRPDVPWSLGRRRNGRISGVGRPHCRQHRQVAAAALSRQADLVGAAGQVWPACAFSQRIA